MTPKAAVALNFDQLLARANHGRLSLIKVSTVVPACMNALANVTAEWNIELRASRESRILLRMTVSVLLLRKRKSRFMPIVISPDRIRVRSEPCFADKDFPFSGPSAGVAPLTEFESLVGVGICVATFRRNSWVAEDARSNAICSATK